MRPAAAGIMQPERDGGLAGGRAVPHDVEAVRAHARMKNQKAIVTIAIGEMYLECWKKYCQPNWQAYAHKYGYDLICLEHPLDLSSRAKLRSPA